MSNKDDAFNKETMTTPSPTPPKEFDLEHECECFECSVQGLHSNAQKCAQQGYKKALELVWDWAKQEQTVAAFDGLAFTHEQLAELKREVARNVFEVAILHARDVAKEHLDMSSNDAVGLVEFLESLSLDDVMDSKELKHGK